MEFNDYPMSPHVGMKFGKGEVDLIWAGFDHIMLSCGLFCCQHRRYVFPLRWALPKDIPGGHYDPRYLEMMRGFWRRISRLVGCGGELPMPALYIALSDWCVRTTVTLTEHRTVQLPTHNFRRSVAHLRHKLDLAWRKLERTAAKRPEAHLLFKQNSAEWQSFVRWFTYHYLDRSLRYGLLPLREYPDDPVPWKFGIPDEPGTEELSLIA
jgi:hypothetical protein